MKQLSIIIALLYSVVLFSQEENNDLYIIEADSTWLKEVIKFPLGFAQDINYEGYEDIRFAKNWSKPDGSEFFTYAFVWNINLEVLPTVEMIETNMKLYYDGLMTAVNKDKDLTIPNTIVDFKKSEKDSELPRFKGNIQVYDSFFTKEVITLYATIETFYCNGENKYVLFFRISTLNYEDAVWKKLKTVKLKEGFCKY